MIRHTDMLWTWLLPEGPADARRAAAERRWLRHGGKWIIFDRRPRLEALADSLAPYIDAGRVHSAKYWNKDPSAMCVYCLDEEKAETWRLLESLGARGSRVWEYDYAWDRNVRNPVVFMYSWFSKLRTILQSYGPAGTLRLVREVLLPRKR
ncbi:MAG: hypothetical protein Kow0025_10520 [Thermodesulfovibrionales bacterium]